MGKRIQEKDGTYASKYKDDMPTELKEIMSRGGGVSTFCSRHSIAKQAFYNWLAKYPEFKEAYEAGKLKCEEHWLSLGEQHLVEHKDAPKLNVALYQLIMRNRFGHSDSRKLNLAQFSKAKTSHDKTRAVAKLLEKDELTPQELRAVNDFISLHHQVEQTEVFAKRIEELENAMKIKEQADAIAT